MNARPCALAPCAGCARHVRTDEAACPFCGAAAEAPAPAAPSPFPLRARTALVATFGALCLRALDAAAGDPAYDNTHDAISLIPQYGAPPDFDPRPRPPRTPVIPAPDAGAPDAAPPGAPTPAPPAPPPRDRRPS